MSDTTAPEVLTEVEDGVLIVTINRPEAKNAMTRAAAEGIAAAMDRLDAEDDLRVGIITGAGGTFCSGMDLKGFLRGESPSIEGRGFGGIVQAPPKKPLIAAKPLDADGARWVFQEFQTRETYYQEGMNFFNMDLDQVKKIMPKPFLPNYLNFGICYPF